MVVSIPRQISPLIGDTSVEAHYNRWQNCEDKVPEKNNFKIIFNGIMDDTFHLE
jgi:hypothetical protein